MSHATGDRIATPSQTVGPFFHIGLSTVGHVGELKEDRVSLRLLVRVTDGDGLPVPDALIEVWSAAGFGRLATGEDGSCEFEVVPTTVAYFSVCLFARGLLRHLHTRVYIGDERALENDDVIALVPEGRRRTLLARRDEHDPGRWLFEIRLQGDDETVFFDL